jgi:folate-binding protein YgfZ
MEATTNAENDATPRWSSIVASGPDATTFLQGQLSQDLSTLSSEGAWSLLLAPDGIVITSLYVTPTLEGYSMSVPRELRDLALARLRRFLLRTKCALEVIDIDDGPFDSLEARIDAARPGTAEFSRNLTPQSFGDSFVTSSVSFTKGCFTGQELVGRLDARGSSVPWRLVRVSGPDESRINAVLTAKGPAGTSGLTTSSRRGDTVVGLGIAHRSLLASEELQRALDVTVEEVA